MNAYANEADCSTANRAEMLRSMAAKKLPKSPAELARRARIGRNLRRAREAVGLQQNEAARLLDVDPTTVNRWERRGQVPRAKWGDIERLYRTTQGAIERGEHGANGTGDPPYPAWKPFLDWLQGSPVREQLEPWMVDSLRRLEFPETKPPTVTTYRLILQAYLLMDEGERPPTR